MEVIALIIPSLQGIHPEVRNFNDKNIRYRCWETQREILEGLVRLIPQTSRGIR